jgi:ABC-type branched-subunit amino acid transport system substrate-binding protein
MPILTALLAMGGGVQAVPLPVRVTLFVALAVLAVGALVVGAREQWREGELPGPVDARQWWGTARVLLPLEAAVGLVLLVSAGLAGDTVPPTTPAGGPPPTPPLAGSPLLLTTAGAHRVPVVLAPGLPGPNRVVVGVQDLDGGGVPQPASGITGVRLGLACGGCGEAPPSLRLEPSGAGWYTGTVTLAAATWSLTPEIEAPSVITARPATATVDPTRPGDLLVGMPADLSGPYGGGCQNRVLGLELATAPTAELPAGGPRPRVVLEDIEPDGAAAATERLAARGVRMLAAPCGGAGTLGAVAGAATRLGLPLVGTLRSEAASPYVWRTGVDQAAEGVALARQVRTQGAAQAVVLVGPRAEQAAEAAAVEDGLGREGVAHQSLSLTASDPVLLAAELGRRRPDALVIIATPRRALPVVEAVSRVGWMPARGIVASSDLMSVSFVEDAVPLLRGTSLAIASELDPADAASREYAGALQLRLPLRAPGIEGARGYYAGLVVDRAAMVAGPDPSPGTLEHALQTAFTAYDLGLFELGWDAGGGGPERLAFFRPAGGGRLLRAGPAVPAR